MKEQIEIKQKESKIDFKRIRKVNFVDVDSEKITIEVDLEE